MWNYILYPNCKCIVSSLKLWIPSSRLKAQGKIPQTNKQRFPLHKLKPQTNRNVVMLVNQIVLKSWQTLQACVDQCSNLYFVGLLNVFCSWNFKISDANKFIAGKQVKDLTSAVKNEEPLIKNIILLSCWQTGCGLDFITHQL